MGWRCFFISLQTRAAVLFKVWSFQRQSVTVFLYSCPGRVVGSAGIARAVLRLLSFYTLHWRYVCDMFPKRSINMLQALQGFTCNCDQRDQVLQKPYSVQASSLYGSSSTYPEVVLPGKISRSCTDN